MCIKLFPIILKIHKCNRRDIIKIAIIKSIILCLKILIVSNKDRYYYLSISILL